jgi:hypothetical protein
MQDHAIREASASIQRHPRIQAAPFPDLRAPAKKTERSDLGTCSDPHVILDNRVRAYSCARSEFRRWRYQGGWMNPLRDRNGGKKPLSGPREGQFRVRCAQQDLSSQGKA